MVAPFCLASIPAERTCSRMICVTSKRVIFVESLPDSSWFRLRRLATIVLMREASSSMTSV